MPLRRPRSARDWRQPSAGENDGGPDVWQRLIRGAWTLIILALVALGLVALWPEIERQKELDREITDLRGLRDEVGRKLKRARAELSWIRSDPGYIEAVARDSLDLRREGETILRIEREK